MEQILNTVVAFATPLLVAMLVAIVAAWGNAMIYAAQMIYQAYLNKDLKTGPEKMAWVVSKVKEYLPTLLSMVLNDKRVQSSCQSIYDAIKMFAVAYLGEKTKIKDGGNDAEEKN